jgi:hypothetical protein
MASDSMIGLSLRDAKRGGRELPTLAKACLKLKHDGHHCRSTSGLSVVGTLTAVAWFAALAFGCRVVLTIINPAVDQIASSATARPSHVSAPPIMDLLHEDPASFLAWDERQVAAWMEVIGYGQYQDLFMGEY